MRCESPFALLLLLLTPLLLERGAFRRLVSVKFSSLIPRPSPLAIRFATISGTLPSMTSRIKVRELVLNVLRAGAFILLVIALARPQLGRTFITSEASGHDLMLTLDISGSMRAVDFAMNNERVTRLEALKFVMKKFIDERQGDRFGLIVFGDQAYTQCPLTLDGKVLKEFVDSLEVGMAGQGTGIGDALALSLKRIRDIPADSKAIILVTDGKNNSGTLSPEQAAELAQKLQIKVHTIGIGGAGPAPFYEKTIFGTTTLVNRNMEYDEKTLKMIAEKTGGQYFNAKDTEALARVYTEIDKLEERIDTTSEYVEYSERFFPFLMLGCLLLLSYELLSSTLLLKVP